MEVNALWHAALKSAARVERLAGETGHARELESEAWHVGRRFNETFWCAEKGYLYDVVGDFPDASLRPNQILAVSLTEDLLPPHRARSVYWAVRRSLLTPFGLRTLAPEDSRYRGRCEGDERSRLAAAHQGTVYPWLMGAFADAHFRVFGNTEESRKTMRAHARAASGARPRRGAGIHLGDVRRRSAPRASRLLRAGVERRRRSRGWCIRT